MKYMSEFRDPKLAAALAAEIRAAMLPGRIYHIMEFCGGHTHAIHRYGIPELLPPEIHLVHGPGCPVCVLPVHRLDQAMVIASQPDTILCTYGDMMRVPGSDRDSLWTVKARGADVRMVYSIDDALAIAEQYPDQRVVFFAIGFETTTPPTAVAILRAQERGLANFSVFCNHVLTPAALYALLSGPGSEDVRVDGFIGPSHVSTIIGTEPYVPIAREFAKPIVVAGFEPLDVLQSLLMLVRQLNEGRCDVENQYSRVVQPEGNRRAQALVADVFEVAPSFAWRGLGELPRSALRLREHYAAFDAERVFAVAPSRGREHPSCECAAVIRGAMSPNGCKLFGKACTPSSPLGACMVSSEGACAAYYAYRPRTLEQEVV